MRTAFLTRPFLHLFILTLLFPSQLLAQKPAPARKTVPRTAPRPRAIADNVIAELLALPPLSPDEEETSAHATSEAEPKLPAAHAPIKELLAYWLNRNSGKSEDARPSEVVQQRLLEAVLNRPELLQGLFSVLPDTPATHDQIYQLMQAESGEEDYWKMTARQYLQYRSQYFREELLAEARSEDFAARRQSLPALAKLDYTTAKPIVEQMLGGTNSEAIALALGIQRTDALSVGERGQAESTLTKLKEIVSNRQLSPPVRWQALSSVMESEWQGQEEWFLSLFADPTLSGIVPDTIAAQNSAEQGAQVTIESKEILVEKRMIVRSAGTVVYGARNAAMSAANAAAAAAARASMDGGVPGGVPDGIPVETANSLLVTTLQGNYAKWIPKVTSLVGNTDRIVHNAAVKFLVEVNGNLQDKEEKMLRANRQDAARALLPWLINPLWASVSVRAEFIDSLNNLDLREAVPGLLTILDSESDRTVVDAAVRVLMEYKDPRAVGSLKRFLQKETSEEAREPIITAIAQCGGFSDEEMATTFEAYARKISTDAGAEAIDIAVDGEKTLPLNLSIGRVLYESDSIQATEGLAVRLFARAKELQFKEPAVAQTILSGIQFAPLQVAQLNLLERISAGNVEAKAISFALENRRAWQKSVSEAIYPLLRQGGYAAGLAAILLGESGRQADILEGKDAKAQLALLAAARYVREKLPVTAIAPLLSNPLLTKAAESYLEIENSAAARSLIWARHPKQAWIVGESIFLENQNDGDATPHKLEEKLQREVLGQNGKLEIYAVLTKFYGTEGEENGNIIVRVKGEEAEIHMPNSNGYRSYRALTPNEVQDLKALTSRPEIEDLGPEYFPNKASEDESDAPSREYLRLNQENGRRILLRQARRAPKKDATPHEELAGLFFTLSRTGDFKLRYDLEDKLPGLEVLYSNAKQQLLMVAQEGKELRVLIGDYSASRQRNKEQFPYDWRSFDAGQLGGIVSPPTAMAEYFEAAKSLGSIELLTSASDYLVAQILPKQKVVYAAMAFGGEPGIWKTTFSGERIKVREGNYLGAVVTPDEKWLVTTKMAMDVQPNAEPHATTTLVRLNLQSGEEFPVALPVGMQLWARAFVPARQQILLSDQAPFRHAPTGKSFLLDPATGKLQSIKGELRPLLQNAVRPLQPTGKPNEVWTSLYDETKRATLIGRYHLATFTFVSALELPGFGAQITELHVDEAAGKVYFVHDGNLLRVALSKH